jgi:DNA invertase Pin-like site-specific DNA recombinase
MEPAKSRIRRCAIYTRKSSEEGLEQDFNSLHAQREACEAYVKSQAGEGWQVIKTAYDDGGYSGGSMERPALGYDVRDRHLLINRAEAVTVKQIYERYLELGSVRLLKHDLDRRGVSSKTRVSMKGLKSGGRSFSRGALYELLANPIYIGEIRHKRERHLGLHEAILERELWERVQQRLREQAAQRGKRPTKAGSSPLAGLLFDQSGEPLYAQCTAKGTRRYRYYVSKGLITGSAKDTQSGWRLSAAEIERAVAIAARSILDDRPGLLEAIENSEIDSPDVRATLETAADYGRRLIAGESING